MSADATVDLGALFDGASRSVVRVEHLPDYDVDTDDESYRAWLEGRPRPERSVRTSRYLQRVAAAEARGVTWERLRVIDTPPTAYQQWELLAYVEGQAVGERVTIAPRDLVPLVGDDFWIVDDAVVLMEYDPRGRFAGMAHATPHGARLYREVADMVRTVGDPLNEYLAELDAPARRAS